MIIDYYRIFNSQYKIINYPFTGLVGYTYKLSKEQQKSHCFKLPAAPECGHQRLSISSLKQKNIPYQDFSQNPNLPLSGGLLYTLTRTSIVNSITVSTYSQGFFKIFNDFFYFRILGCPPVIYCQFEGIVQKRLKLGI